MTTLQNLFNSPEKFYTVKSTDTNNYNVLLPNILYTEMENFAKEVILSNSSIAYPIPQLYKLQILKSVYADEHLVFKTQIVKYSEFELQLLVNVSKKELSEEEKEDMICKAVFKFNLKESISRAS